MKSMTSESEGNGSGVEGAQGAASAMSSGQNVQSAQQQVLEQQVPVQAHEPAAADSQEAKVELTLQKLRRLARKNRFKRRLLKVIPIVIES